MFCKGATTAALSVTPLAAQCCHQRLSAERRRVLERLLPDTLLVGWAIAHVHVVRRGLRWAAGIRVVKEILRET